MRQNDPIHINVVSVIQKKLRFNLFFGLSARMTIPTTISRTAVPRRHSA
jgi:hypothetical protein